MVVNNGMTLLDCFFNEVRSSTLYFWWFRNWVNWTALQGTDLITCLHQNRKHKRNPLIYILAYSLSPKKSELCALSSINKFLRWTVVLVRMEECISEGYVIVVTRQILGAWKCLVHNPVALVINVDWLKLYLLNFACVVLLVDFTWTIVWDVIIIGLIFFLNCQEQITFEAKFHELVLDFLKIFLQLVLIRVIHLEILLWNRNIRGCLLYLTRQLLVTPIFSIYLFIFLLQNVYRKNVERFHSFLFLKLKLILVFILVVFSKLFGGLLVDFFFIVNIAID